MIKGASGFMDGYFIFSCLTYGCTLKYLPSADFISVSFLLYFLFLISSEMFQLFENHMGNESGNEHTHGHVL